MKTYQLGCRTRGNRRPFLEFSFAQKTWNALRFAYPQAQACVLMPDHFHIVVPAREHSRAEERRVLKPLVSIMNRLRGTPSKIEWTDPWAGEVANEDHLERLIRYVILNPCRAGLVPNPARWFWSTYRDAIGKTHRPWGVPAKILRDVGERRRWVEYILADLAVTEKGVGAPIGSLKSEPWSEITRCGLFELEAAIVNAMRIHPARLKRRRARERKLFVSMAMKLWWRQGATLAKYIELSPRQARRYSRFGNGAIPGELAIQAWIDDPVNRHRPVGIAAEDWPFRVQVK